MIAINIYNFFPLLSSILFLILGVLVLIKDRKSKTNIAFLFVCISTFIWQFSWFLLFPTRDAASASLLIKIGWVGIILIPVSFYNFATFFLGIRNSLNRIFLIIVHMTAVAFLYFLLFSNFFIDGYHNFFWGLYPKAGMLHPFFLLFLLIIIVRIFYLFFLYYSSQSLAKLKVYQLKFLLIAVTFYILSSVDFLINYGIEIYPFGFIFILIFLAIISYAIVRHRLLDIKLVLRRSSVAGASLGVVIGSAVGIKFLSREYFPDYGLTINFLVLAGAIFAYPRLSEFFYKVANKYFFTSLYDSRKVILDTTNRIRTILEENKIYKLLDDTFRRIFGVEKFGVLDLDDDGKNYTISYNRGFKLEGKEKFPANPTLHKAFIEKNKSIILEEVKDLYYSKDTKETIKMMEKAGVEVLAPLNIKKRTIGLLVLGPKETGEMFNKEDLQLMEIIGGQSAISIENAQLYSEVVNFNEKLKREVKKATADLEETNRKIRRANSKLSGAYKKLRQLDEAKNEFISIASHQLRTPLTSIKGFISMIMEGDYGKLSASINRVLKKIYISNERLIKLVNDLLSISRIEAGRFTFNFRKNNLPQMVSKIMDTFELEAKEKNLRLTYHPPEKEMEDFIFDKEKLQEVISNLIDNAVKYTQEGKVEVSVKDNPEKARITVSDSGRGMAGNELEAVFEKFRRGSKSTSVDTEGTGLGLYVCQKIVTAHQGKIWAESDGPGKGSRFIVEIPKDLKPSEGETKKKAKEKENPKS
ncbi:MAG: ATP-binding protein [Candidatus Moranbacteria bacterium]|nr:ATP-binding protein [Candidatus Moranbacteria bacterium]